MTTDATPITFTVTARAPRLDVWLAAAHPAITRSRWQQLIKDGHITLNGTPLRKNRLPSARTMKGTGSTSI